MRGFSGSRSTIPSTCWSWAAKTCSCRGCKGVRISSASEDELSGVLESLDSDCASLAVT